MGATRPRFDVAIAAKAGADVVVVDGAEGGTGASPELLLNHTGIPTMSAIRAAREALDECGMTGKVDLVAAGGISTGVDAAKCLALGADAVMIGNGAMMALGCNSPRYLDDYKKLGTSPGACHHCHTGLCPVGVATQDPELEKRMHVPGGRGTRRPLPDGHDHGNHVARQGLRQKLGAQSGGRGFARAVLRGVGVHRREDGGDRSGV